MKVENQLCVRKVSGTSLINIYLREGKENKMVFQTSVKNWLSMAKRPFIYIDLKRKNEERLIPSTAKSKAIRKKYAERNAQT